MYVCMYTHNYNVLNNILMRHTVLSYNRCFGQIIHINMRYNYKSSNACTHRTIGIHILNNAVIKLKSTLIFKVS